MPHVLSVIIPAYKEENTIVQTLEKLEEVLNRLPISDYEVICVVDGFLDKTYDKASKLSSKKIKVVGYEKNRGKGYAVRFGMAQAKGDLIAYMDANGLNPSGLEMLLLHFNWYKADIVVASKRHPVSQVKYPWQRRVFSWGYQQLVRWLFGLQVKDTQVGMKIFKREVIKKVLPRTLVKEFAFDIEMLSVANYLGFNRIYEAPVQLSLNFTTSSIVSKGSQRMIFLMFRDTLAVFYRLKILHYYDDANKDNWIKQ